MTKCCETDREAPAEVDYRETCIVAGAMRTADLAWRATLAGQTLADIRADVDRIHPQAREATLNHFLNAG